MTKAVFIYCFISASSSVHIRMLICCNLCGRFLTTICIFISMWMRREAIAEINSSGEVRKCAKHFCWCGLVSTKQRSWGVSGNPITLSQFEATLEFQKGREARDVKRRNTVMSKCAGQPTSFKLLCSRKFLSLIDHGNATISGAS